MRKTCGDQNQNRLRQRLWRRALLGQWGLSLLGFGEEFRGANHRHVEVVVRAILIKRLLKSRVRKMGAIPCQQIVHPVNNREGNMRRVHLSLLGQLQQLDDGIGQRLNFGGDLKFRDADHRPQSLGGRRDITFGHFGADRNRREETKPRPLAIPPLLRDPLMRFHRLLMAAVRSQVAGNRRLNVNRLHGLRSYPAIDFRQDRARRGTPIWRLPEQSCSPSGRFWG
jgi:hypothetical protein